MNRESKNRLTQIVNWSLMHGRRQHKGAKTVFSTNSTGASRCSNAKEKKEKEYRHRPYTLHKYHVKIDLRPKYKTQNYKNHRR